MSLEGKNYTPAIRRKEKCSWETGFLTSFSTTTMSHIIFRTGTGHLGRNENKEQFTALLSHNLIRTRILCEIAAGDADMLILSANRYNYIPPRRGHCCWRRYRPSCFVVSSNTLACETVLFLKSGKGKNPHYLYDIHDIQQKMPSVEERIFDCDTTSARYRKGKKMAYKKLKGEEMIKVLSTFTYSDSCSNDVVKADCQYIMNLYGTRKKNVPLSKFRLGRFVASAN